MELYELLPPGEDPAIVHTAVPPGASILELGAGAGRMTHPLLRLGHPLVAVDESPGMLARVHGAETVRAKIQSLDLGRRFDVVLLTSHLVNVPDHGLRLRFLRTCRRHLLPGGCVLLQRHEPAWFEQAQEGERTAGAVTVGLRDLRRPAPGLLSATVEYRAGERAWRQWFTARRLDDAELAAALAEAGLAVDAYLTEDRTWVRAVPTAPDAAAPEAAAPEAGAPGRSPR